MIYLRSIPAVASSEPATIAPPAPASPKEGGAVADALGRKVFQQACASWHSWTGVSELSPFATISGSRAVNDPTATNVAQIVISGTPGGGQLHYWSVWQCRVQLTAKDVTELRGQTGHWAAWVVNT